MSDIEQKVLESFSDNDLYAELNRRAWEKRDKEAEEALSMPVPQPLEKPNLKKFEELRSKLHRELQDNQGYHLPGQDQIWDCIAEDVIDMCFPPEIWEWITKNNEFAD